MNAQMFVKSSPFAVLESVKSMLPTTPVTPIVKEVDSAERDRKVRNVISTALKGAGVPVAALEAAADDMLTAFVAATGGKPKSAPVAEAALRTPQGKVELAALAAKYRPAPVVQPASEPVVVAAKAPRVAPTSNNLLPEVEERLHALLLAAVASGEEGEIDAALKEIVAASPGCFVTRFQNWTRVSSLLIGRLRAIGVLYGLYWTEGGLGNEVLPVKPKTAEPVVAKDALTPDVEAELLGVLRTAMRNGTKAQLQETVRALVDACRAHGVDEFSTPYKPHAWASNMLMKAWVAVKADGESFWFNFPINGLEMEVQEEPVPMKPSSKRAETERRVAANRAARHAAQPRKGPAVGKK